jgi:diazepam-binding inhibitor (GABA receptor modulating acyl-CoA-binding protein)
MNNEPSFEQAIIDVQNLKIKPEDKELLKLYGLYKQSLFGNNNTSKPFVLNFKDNAKWNAWNELRGKGKIRAKNEYISFVEELKNKYGIK